MADVLRPLGQRIRVFGGIDNDTTSRQGLECLFDIGVQVNAVATGGAGPIFHPKVFLAKGRHEMRVLVGSANLTRRGLSQNVEAGIFLRLSLEKAGDQTIVKQVSTKLIEPLEALRTRCPKNVFEIKDKDDLLNWRDLD